ncbi:hypothetical protein ASE09_28030 [Streptomyces sp. Root66D1]|nr:hypothetical protein ASD33_26840 [Streptomyces sp. Root1304]KRA95322.1 hypothetical protein ASE09_28030 [Streptomyces sp. Root66D1]
MVMGVLFATALALAASGATELLTGWIHPWERSRVLRPGPHGLGLLLSGSGLCCFFGVLAFTPTGTAFLSLMAAAAGLFLTGTALIAVSRIP